MNGPAPQPIAPSASSAPMPPPPGAAANRRIGLVGCVKDKAGRAMQAQDLYVSTLFRGRRAYVERTCTEWWILSALHGLVHPHAVLEPYDVTLNAMGRAVRRAWSSCVLTAVDHYVRPGPGVMIEVHAGSEYRDFGLVDGLRARGCTIEIPTAGMPIGRQLQFYKNAQEHR